MPTIITMKAPENLNQSNSSSLTNITDNLVSINSTNQGDFKIHKHTISVKNIPASNITNGAHTCSSDKSDRYSQISNTSSSAPNSTSNYAGKVTLTINSVAASETMGDKQPSNGKKPQSTSSDNKPRNNTRNSQQLVKSEKNITKCSLGSVSSLTETSACSPVINDNNNFRNNKNKSVTDSELDEVLSFPSNHKTTSNSANNINNSKVPTAQVFSNSISKPNPYCPSCHGAVPISHTEPSDLSLTKESGFWNSNNFHTNLHREASFHSYGGFTLNGQAGHISAKKHKMRRFCSSHKVAFVVSTFSLIVTIGLVITLLLMKKKGMMEAMR